MGRLQDKVALVTGAGSGIGRQTALRFAEEGAAVMAVDLVEETAAETASLIAAEGGRALSGRMDVTRATEIEAGVQRTVDELGAVDVVVNNAGITIVGAAHDLEEDDWDKELTINLKSVYLVSKAVWPRMKARGGGSIVSTASIAGLWAIPDDAAYCASKAGVVMLTKCMALDGAKDGIRVNCVCPGFIQTPMIDGYFADQPDPEASRQFAVGLHPLGRLGEPLDIADGFVYLASDEARWVTGTALVVDGGLTSGIWGG
ncbi:SDR family NAD(P)-dependent oxidoreductase [Capillimicrobium parvum]|uniref:Dihydroanticapsin 7-dehydrogenase n=1 Tax=Capillimicrobium parvum TaxID=2884022 RepID=A0A9E7C6U8_9ACTN|nr:SDR family oxidoreductase [Capillimicrobium parvum]UGS39149.1 Dihydroanticapsin 7-dehydrogenase [Capillimicrobium parvum]